MDLVDLVRAHNARVAQHAELVHAAAELVERHHLKAEEELLDQLTSQIRAANTRAQDCTSRLRACTEEIASLTHIEGDPAPSASVLNVEVARLLGRSELRFEVVNDRYSIKRNGRPAVGLSTGERNAIALVYFLESVARFNPVYGKPIVVIDDPVSSLDSNTFLGVSTYIWSEVLSKKIAGQLLLLTHNFELFRQWDIQLERLPGPVAREFPARLYELRTRVELDAAGSTARKPQLADWPPTESSRKKVRSTYHHSFMELVRAKQELVASDSLETRLNAQLLFPNVIRRMLETFIAFKRPEWAGDLTTAMLNSAQLVREGGFQGNADALRLRLTRYANVNSHSETPATNEVVSPDEVESAITASFHFMHYVDSHHFNGLCEVVGVDARQVLGPLVNDATDLAAPSSD